MNDTFFTIYMKKECDIYHTDTRKLFHAVVMEENFL